MKEQSNFKKAKSSIQQINSLFNTIPGGVAQFFLDDKIELIYANDTFYELTGYTQEEFDRIFLMNPLDIIYQPDLQRMYEAVMLQIFKEELLKGDFRIVRKNGELRWISLTGNRTMTEDEEWMYQCIFMDNTNLKLAQEELEYQKMLDHIVLAYLDNMIYDYDFAKDVMHISRKHDQAMGNDSDKEEVELWIANYRSMVNEGTSVFSDDRSKMQPILDGSGHICTEIRMRGLEKKDGYLWYEIKGTTYCNREGVPCCSIGVMTNIDEKKKNLERLQFRAERDLLTQLYNKISVNAMIENYLESEGVDRNHALLVLDLDNFKSANDLYGHQFGDVVLNKVAENLVKVFRKSDIIGRVGGDEFVVFLKDIVDEDVVHEKIEALCRNFREIHFERNDEYIVTGSMGISMYPKDGNTYNELFRKADLAMYTAKDSEESRYFFYCEGQHMAKKDHDNIRNSSVSCSMEEMGSYQLLRSVIELCNRPGVLRECIEAILKLAAAHYKVSRAYLIIDTPKAGNYEWCKDGIAKRSHTFLFGKTDDFYSGYYRYIDPIKKTLAFENIESIKEEHPDFYELAHKADIMAILQVELIGYSSHGYLGFDDCESTRVWTEREINVLKIIVKMIDIYFLKE